MESSEAVQQKKCYVYILCCSDGTLYTGWTTDVVRRLKAHNAGKAGAKYTRSRRPVKLVYAEEQPGMSEALKREAAVKKLTRQEKLTLIEQDTNLVNFLINPAGLK